MERPSRQLFKVIGEERQTSAQRLENDTLEEWMSLLEKIPFSSVSYDCNGFKRNGGFEVELCLQDYPYEDTHAVIFTYFSINAYFRSGGIAFIESCEVKYVEGGKISKFEGTWEDVFLKLLEIGNALASVDYPDCRYEDD
jgi:hypothetical protein